jgi:hypothetical protein
MVRPREPHADARFGPQHREHAEAARSCQPHGLSNARYRVLGRAPCVRSASLPFVHDEASWLVARAAPIVDGRSNIRRCKGRARAMQPQTRQRVHETVQWVVTEHERTLLAMADGGGSPCAIRK